MPKAHITISLSMKALEAKSKIDNFSAWVESKLMAEKNKPYKVTPEPPNSIRVTKVKPPIEKKSLDTPEQVKKVFKTNGAEMCKKHGVRKLSCGCK